MLGELYDGEFESMEHNGRMDACMCEKMTREEIENFRKIVKPFVAKRLLVTNYEGMGKTDKAEFERDFDTILDLAISALEAKPCEDAISRQALIEGWASIAKAKAKSDAQKALMGRCLYFAEHLPPVTPKQRTGHWVEEIDDYGEVICWHCDKCYEDSGFTTDCKWDFCPNCGAKMESEVQA